MRSTSHRGATWRRRAMLSLGACSLALQWGCYSYLPVQSAPPTTQQRGAVVLNDQGRALLSDRLGTAIDRVEGTFVSHDSTGVVLEVTGTKDLRGGSSLWSGERVEIPSVAILGFQERQLSKPRSFLLAGSVVGLIAVATFGLTLDLFGEDTGRSETANPRDPGGSPISTRGLLPVSLP